MPRIVLRCENLLAARICSVDFYSIKYDFFSELLEIEAGYF